MWLERDYLWFDSGASIALKSSLITRKVRNYFAKNQE